MDESRVRAATRRITAADGISLAVQERGDPEAPTVLAVHGYPDDHHVWDGVSAELAERFHVVTCDVRGAGESDAPADRDGYRLDRLEGDLARIVEELSPYRPVHLLAHDWGAIQTWHAVTGTLLDGRIASFTSISGPCLDHAAHWFRSRLRRPTPRRLRELLTQLVHSGYIGFFQTPLLPELAWRTGLMPRVINRLARGDTRRNPSTRDGVNGLELYRANIASRAGRPAARRAGVPVQVVAPVGDPFVSAPLQTDIARWAPDLRVRRVPGGHWLPSTRPQLVARCAAELVDHVETGRQTRALRRAGRQARDHADQLAVVTGAGSGIGRATALALADEGADVAVVDRDAAAAEDTAQRIRSRGREATAHAVDVADGEAVEAMAEQVCGQHGVPDLVINNAGVAVAGPFSATSADEWQRVVDVNLWGVVHGCRAFAGRMAERGEGGQIVTVASAAAYLPSRSLPAYSTTKSAVLALSECLRAELAADGIGVTAVCPGFVHTDITNRVRFAGLDEQEQAARRGRATRLYRFRGYTPERAARAILRAARSNRALAPVTAEARIGLVLSRLAPGLVRALAKRDIAR